MSEWRVAPLREIADIRVSNVDKKSTPGEAPVRLCNYMDVYANDYIRADLPFMEATATAAEIQRFGVQQGDVMITKDSETPDDIGIPAVVMDQIEGLVCGYHLAQLRPNRALIDPVYLAKQLALPETAAYFAQRAAGSTRYGLSNRTIAEVPIRLAPLGQQQRIAEILARIDGAIERTELLIDKHQQIKAGLMHDLFTRGVLPNGDLRQTCESEPTAYRSTRLGPAPKAWVEKRCAELCSRICVGIVIQPAQYYTAEGVPALRSANVRENEIDLSGLVRISTTSNQLLSKSQLRAGDIVTVRTGYPGTSAVVPQTLAGANCIDILISSPGPEVDSTFLSYWLNSSFGKGQVLRKQGGLAQQHFNVGDMRELLVLVPDLEEQLRIRDRLVAADDRLHADQNRLDKLRLQKRGLMQDLLTGRVAVKVPEPAIAA